MTIAGMSTSPTIDAGTMTWTDAAEHLMDLRSLRAPLLIMRRELLTDAYEKFQKAFDGVAVHFAVKCNPDPDVLRHLHEIGSGFEVASSTEIAALQVLGVDPSEVLFSNPIRSRAEIEAAAAAGTWRFAVDSNRELFKLAETAPGASVYARIATTAGESLVPSEGKFGCSVTEAIRLLRGARQLGLEPYGLAFHVGSQMTDPGAWDQPFADVVAITTALAEQGIRLQMLDIGGGYPATYTRDVPALQEFGRRISELKDTLPYPMQLVVEPGRALVAEAGFLLCEVIQVATRGAVRWAHTNLGVFNGMMEVLESSGTLEFPIHALRKSPYQAKFNITGPTCDSQDTFAIGVELPRDLKEGDVLAVGTTGAYTTAYATTFNGFPVPSTVVV